MSNLTLSDEEQKRLQVIDSGAQRIDSIINQTYLINISARDVVPIKDSGKNTANIRLFYIDKLVYDAKEDINEKLVSIYGSLQDLNASAIMILDGDDKGVRFYLGIRSWGDVNAKTVAEVLQKTVLGNFPGSQLTSLSGDSINKLLSKITEGSDEDPGRREKSVATVTMVPTSRQTTESAEFVQGLEKFIDIMQGETYSAIFIAHPIVKEVLEQRKHAFEDLYSAVSPLERVTLSYGTSNNTTITTGISESFSHSIGSSISNAIGHSIGTSDSTSDARGNNTNYGLAGFGAGNSSTRTSAHGYTAGQTWSRTMSETLSDTTGSGKSDSTADSQGTSQTMSVEHQNKSISELLEQIDAQLERLKQCEAYGVWECAAYFIAIDDKTSTLAANTYRSLLLGDNAAVEKSFINKWFAFNPENTTRMLEYLRYVQHPVLFIPRGGELPSQYVTVGNMISGKELPLLMGFPRKSVRGITVDGQAAFGRNVVYLSSGDHQGGIELGEIHHMGHTEEHHTLELDMQSFTGHCFVTGATGSGKSNTVYNLLENFLQNGIPFLVVEPAKGEYKDVFSKVSGLNVFTTNPCLGTLLKINPFRFHPNIHVLEHLDRLIEIFSACWEMSAAMPAIFKASVERVYVEKGWDLFNSIYVGEGPACYPTFADLLAVLPKVIEESDYSGELKGNYSGALVTRVESLTNGISGQIFCDCYDIPEEILFDRSAIVDLSRIGSNETKSLIMGLLVLKLNEYRMANADGSNHSLRHVTVLEEAHNLLKRASASGGNSVVEKAVLMLCNSIAEMRTYGESFIIVDQSPSAVDATAIKNTNTKILMRLPGQDDGRQIGAAMSLSDDQILEIPRLETGIAIVIQNNWQEAVLCHVKACPTDYSERITPIPYSVIKSARGTIIKSLLDSYESGRSLASALRAVEECNDLPERKKEEYRLCLQTVLPNLMGAKPNGMLFGELLLSLSGAEGVLKAAERSLNEKDPSSVAAWESNILHLLGECANLTYDYRKKLLRFLMPAFDRRSTVSYSTVKKSIERRTPNGNI